MQSHRPNRIAIDGPVGAGKTTVGREFARRSGYRFLDTGVMYRAVTLAALKKGVGFEKEEALSALAAAPAIQISFDGEGEARVTIEGRDVTHELRDARVDHGVSAVSAHSRIRAILVRRQQEIASEAPIVMVGRDIGTVVLPDADLKVFLTAGVEERARRRHGELVAAGNDVSYEEIFRSLKRRDEIDSSRAVSPLRPAEDAVRLNTDALSFEAAVERLASLAGAVRTPGALDRRGG